MMKTRQVVRLTLAVAALLVGVQWAAGQIPAPWDWQGSFWNNPEAVKKLKLTETQQRELNGILDKANAQFVRELRGKLTPGQWKQIQALEGNQPHAAARMGLLGPDARRVAAALHAGHTTTENYLTLVNVVFRDSVNIGVRLLSVSRGQTTDPCKTATDAIMLAAPNLNAKEIRLTFELHGKHYAGNSCPAAVADLVQGEGATVTATYPCAVTTEGVDLVPGCQLSTTEIQLVQ